MGIMWSTLFPIIFCSLFTSEAKPFNQLQARATVVIPGYDYAGCYSEVPNRALNEKVSYNDSMTLESCAAACTGYIWWGAEYGRECYCGNTLQPGSVAVPISSCSYSCPGNSQESCGAGNFLTMYAKTGTVAPALPLTVYGSQGCYTEATTGRALTDASTTSDQMTIENCAAFCSGYSFFGVEFGRECYCGNNLQAGSVKALASACPYTCTGNSEESCGGAMHLELYQFGAASIPAVASITTFNRLGCYGETYPTRALSELSYFDDTMTVEKCSMACSGYLYFGLEYGRECYCGNDILPASVTTGISDSECNFPCPGDNTEHCGAGNRIDMYEFGPKTSSTPSLSSSSSVLNSITSSTSPSTVVSSSSSSVSSPITTSTSTSTVVTSTSTTSSIISSTSSSSSPGPSILSSGSSTVTSSQTSSSSSTSTSSTLPLNPTPTSPLMLPLGVRNGGLGLFLVNSHMAVPYSAGLSVSIVTIRSGGQPYLASDPSMKMFLTGASGPSSTYGVLSFESETTAAQTPVGFAVTCSVDNQGVLSCATVSGKPFNTVFSCGMYVYLGLSTFTQSNCLATTLNLVTNT